MPRPRSKYLGLAVLAAALALVASIPATAAHAATRDNVSCWKRLLNDWYDGRIDKIYPIPCYSEAIKHLPPETEIYGSAKEDILAARQAAINKQAAPPEKAPPATTNTAAGTTSAGETSTGETPPPVTTTSTTTETTNGTTTTAVVIVANPPTTTPKKKGGISGALADITPGDPQAFPLPLLILGALAILLVIAGAVGMLWQRSHPRDEPPLA
jgi:hypothetical protein